MKNPTPKIVGKLTVKIPNISDEWKGYPEFFSIRNRNFSGFFFSNRYFPEKAVVACVSLVGSSYI